MRRLVDFAAALVGLVLTSPFFLVAAVAIKAGSPGPVFFKGVRVGKDGREFRIVKKFWRPAELTERVRPLGFDLDLRLSENGQLPVRIRSMTGEQLLAEGGRAILDLVYRT